MRSLPKVIKLVELGEEIFHIPDSAPPPPPAPSDDSLPPGEEPLEEVQEPKRDLEAEERAARERIQRLTQEAKEQAEEMGQRVLQSAKNEREKIMAQAQADAGRLREEARQTGYQEALDQTKQQIQGRLAELDRLMEQLQRDQDRFLRQYQEGLSALSLEIAQKVLDEAVINDASLMRPLVQKAVASVKNAEWISVEVSARLPGLVEELKTLLTGRPDLPRLDVTAAELPPGGCVVHTPEGMVDASVDTQLGNLAALFQQPR